jgi:hypothetical protein
MPSAIVTGANRDWIGVRHQLSKLGANFRCHPWRSKTDALRHCYRSEP